MTNREALLAGVGSFAAGALIGGVLKARSIYSEQKHERIFTTSNKVEEEVFEPAKKIYSDPESDLAIYYDESYAPEPIEVGTHLYIGYWYPGKGRVVDSTEDTIIIKTKPFAGDIIGCAVYTRLGKKVGFVSALIGSNRVKVVLS